MISQEITSAGVSIDPYMGNGVVASLFMFSSGTVTLAGNVSISPDITYISATHFSVRWNASLVLGSFTVTICGKVINQDQVNQSGTFDCYYDGSSWTVYYYADGSDQPQRAQGVSTVTVPVGGTLTLVAGESKAYQRLSGAPTTLTSNYTVTAATSGVKPGSRFDIEIAGGITTAGNTITVFGVTVPSDRALSGGISIAAVFDGSSWNGISSSGPVSPSDLGNIPAASILGNSSGIAAPPSNFDLASDGDVLMRVAGVLASSKIGKSNFASTLVAIEKTTKLIGASELANGYSSPIPVISAPGVGLITIPILAYVSATYNTSTYTTYLDGTLIHTGATVPLMKRQGLLGFTSSLGMIMLPANLTTAVAQAVPNAIMNFQVDSGDPLVGDGTLSITIIYITLTA